MEPSPCRKVCFTSAVLPALRQLCVRNWQEGWPFPLELLAQLDFLYVDARNPFDSSPYLGIHVIDAIPLNLPVLCRAGIYPNADIHHVALPLVPLPPFLWIAINLGSEVEDEQGRWSLNYVGLLGEIRLLFARQPHLRLFLVPRELWWIPQDAPPRASWEKWAVEVECAKRGIDIRLYEQSPPLDGIGVPEFRAYLREKGVAAGPGDCVECDDVPTSAFEIESVEQRSPRAAAAPVSAQRALRRLVGDRCASIRSDYTLRASRRFTLSQQRALLVHPSRLTGPEEAPALRDSGFGLSFDGARDASDRLNHSASSVSWLCTCGRRSSLWLELSPDRRQSAKVARRDRSAGRGSLAANAATLEWEREEMHDGIMIAPTRQEI